VSSGASSLEAVAAQARAQLAQASATDVKFCGVDDPTCEACQ
jgi:ribonucleoside-diphosphate reductase alpha chain